MTDGNICWMCGEEMGADYKAHECKERPAGPNIEMCYKIGAYCERLSVLSTEFCDAHAEVERLRAALREIEDINPDGIDVFHDMRNIARKALADGGKEGEDE